MSRDHWWKVTTLTTASTQRSVTQKFRSLMECRSAVYGIREFKRLRRLLRRKRHIRIELSVSLSVLRLLMFVSLYETGEVHFCLLGTNDFHVKAESKNFTAACVLALSSEPRI